MSATVSKRKRRWLRAVLLLLPLAAATIAHRAAGDETRTALGKLGESLRQAAGTSNGDVRHLVLNGVRIGVQTSTTSDSVAQVLDRAASECDGLHVIRDGDDNSAFVACVEGTGSGELGLLDIGIELTSQTMSDVGIVKYVQAHRKGNQTEVVRLDTDNALSIPRLMPSQGDAPGFDLASIPRPPGSNRWLSFREEGYDYESVIYGHGESSPGDTMSWYRRALGQKGWKIYGPEDVGRDNDTFLYALKGKSLVLLVFGSDCNGTCTAAIGADTSILDDVRP